MPADVYLKTSNYPAPAWDPAHATISAPSTLPTVDYLVTTASGYQLGAGRQKLRWGLLALPSPRRPLSPYIQSCPLESHRDEGALSALI